MSTPPVPAATALITGAGRGIGRAVALDLAERTCTRLVLVSRTSTCEATAVACNAIRPGSATALQWDLAAFDEGAPRLEALLANLPSPVALVHCAGVLGPTGPFAESRMDDFLAALSVNLVSGLRLVHGLLGRMRREGAGRLVLFAGGGAAYGYPNFASYGTAKVALVRFAETLAMELGDSGPLITIIAPGANDTDMLAEVRRAGGYVKTTVAMDEPCRLVRRLLVEDTRGLHGRFVHVRDEWTGESALGLGNDHWKLRRVE